MKIDSLKDGVVYRLNSSNPGKIAEYKKYLGSEIFTENKDIQEPVADAITIVRYKASQFEGVLVDDVSLEVEGEEIGVHIKWHLGRLKDLVGRKASFKCIIGIRIDKEVSLFEGMVAGEIVTPRGSSFGFNPYFQPQGSNFTLAERIIDPMNARYLALQKLLNNTPDYILKPLFKWDGSFQA